MEVNELINLIMNNGFPVAVSAYLLIRLEKQIVSLTGSINRLNTIISAKLGVPINPEKASDYSGTGSDCEKTA
ncbi:MAG: YvrJ family protein [Clostridium sp.]|nr:YvrJ family protein [Clostridium sp.]